MSTEKKPRPSIEEMREEVTLFEIEEVYYSKDYQAMVEDGDMSDPWKSEEDIVEHYKKEDDEGIEDLWEEWFNQFEGYEEKKNEN